MIQQIINLESPPIRRLRDYQQQAVDSTLTALQAGLDPVVSLPTGSGKSLVAAAIARQTPGRVLVLSHVKELLQQDEASLNAYAPEIQTGVYSAGLNRRETDAQVTFAGVASIYQRMEELQAAGPIAVIMIDEAHRIAPRHQNGILYRQCLDALPHARRVGLTATPYRLDSGQLHEGDGAWFNHLSIHIPPSDLVQSGYLSPLVGVGAAHRMNPEAAGVHMRAGEFVTSELSQIACEEILIQSTIQELLRLSQGRQHGLIFAIDVAHVEAITAELVRLGEDVDSITGATPAEERADRIVRFKAGSLRWLVNCNVLTTGFDAPDTDVLVLLRPTASKSLHVQMLGRGMRLANGKKDCLVLDFAGNIRRHGSLDHLADYTSLPTPEEEKRKAEMTRTARQRQIEHSPRALAGDPMTGGVVNEEWRVLAVNYAMSPSKKYPDKINVRVTYRCEGGQRVNQWLCVEYPGGARWHAQQWFQRRGLLMPAQAIDACDLARSAIKPDSISVYFEGQWPRVAVEHFAHNHGIDEDLDAAD